MVEKVRRGEIEEGAGREIIRRSKCLAPAYNKGAYQYIGTEEMAHDAGRKGQTKGER